METITSKKALWTCPACGRKFERKNQSHSCKIYPLEKHFEGKVEGEKLYENLKHKLKKAIGSFKIQSLECCIHFDKKSTFSTVKIFRNKIQVEFSLSNKIINERVLKVVQLSANKYLHFTNITNTNEIDNELIEWIQEAYKNN
jgi:uncharacterized protein YktA (UPF0223 family)